MKAGLEDVIAGESGICYIDGEKGILAYRGYNIHELATNSTFEETCHLLWFGRLPKQGELADTTKKLVAFRAIPQQIIDWMKSFPKKALPMEVLRTTVSMLSMFDPETEDMSPEATLRKAIRLTAQAATLVTAFDRIRNGKDPVAPRADLSHAANFAYMLNGTLPNDTMTKALDIALILHADHEWNASTFAGRVTAATLSDIYSAATSAIGALKGPLHGGANEAVMRMLLEIGDPSKVDSYVRNIFAQKKKIPGFGHRVYHTEDPRATHLRRMSKELCERAGQPKWYEMSARIEELVKSEKKLNANVDFYSATTYHVIGMPIDLFTPFFAVSRRAAGRPTSSSGRASSGPTTAETICLLFRICIIAAGVASGSPAASA